MVSLHLVNQLQPFSLSVRVEGREAKQDGIILELGDWFIEGIGNDIGAFMDLLGPPLPAPDGTEESGRRWTNILTSLPVATIEPEFFGWMLNRPAGNMDSQTEMRLRGGGQGSLPRPGAPLAKGKLRILFRAPLDGEEETRRRQLRLTLFLNPTRFVRYQPRPDNYLEDPRTWRLGPANLRALPRESQQRQQASGRNEEISLDGNDNVLTGSRARAFARPDAWPIHLRRYLDAVESELEREFRRAAHALGSGRLAPENYSRAPYYSLKKVETYFEFSTRNPTQMMRRLAPALETVGRQFQSRKFPNGYCEGDGDQDATRVLLTLGSGRMLRVYAKTTHRLRFEIIHDTTKASVNRLFHENGSGHTTNHIAEIRRWIQVLAWDAATKLNQVLSMLEERCGAIEDSANTYEFLSAIFSAVRDGTRAEHIVRLLVENGCLRIERRGSEFLHEIRQLRRKKVLEKVGGANVVKPLYRAALDTLRQQAGLPPLAIAM